MEKIVIKNRRNIFVSLYYWKRLRHIDEFLKNE